MNYSFIPSVNHSLSKRFSSSASVQNISQSPARHKGSLDLFLALRSSPMALQVKNLPAMQEIKEMWVRSWDQEDPLEKEMATHSSILAWRIPWTEEPGRL